MKTYQTSSATICVERTGLCSTVVAVSTVGCRRGVEFHFDGSGRKAARWLAEQDLTGRVWAGMSWDELRDAVAAPQPVAAAVEPAVAVAASSADIAAQVEALVTARVEEILADHYRWVLADKSRRAVVAKLLRDANTLERAAEVKKASR